jgi:hypothetical protein
MQIPKKEVKPMLFSYDKLPIIEPKSVNHKLSQKCKICLKSTVAECSNKNFLVNHINITGNVVIRIPSSEGNYEV